MSWRVSIVCAATVSAAAMCFSSGSATADEAYLCGPDKVVYVAVEDLERKKHTDPCIAAYYGLKIDAPKVEPEVTRVSVREDEKKAKVAGFKPLSDTEIPDVINNRNELHASLELPRPAPGTDYRNVKIINATSNDGAWYRHTK